MHGLGVRNGADLRSWSRWDLNKHFGKTGSFYYDIARAIDERPVRTERIPKSIGKEKTFEQDVDSVEWLNDYLVNLSEKVAERLNREGAEARTVTLKLRYDNFDSLTRSFTPGHLISGAPEIAELAFRLLKETEAGSRKVRLIGVTVSGFERGHGSGQEGQQMSLPLE